MDPRVQCRIRPGEDTITDAKLTQSIELILKMRRAVNPKTIQPAARPAFILWTTITVDDADGPQKGTAPTIPPKQGKATKLITRLKTCACCRNPANRHLFRRLALVVPCHVPGTAPVGT